MKKQKKDKRRQSTQQLMGVKKITDYRAGDPGRAFDTGCCNVRYGNHQHLPVFC